MSRDGAGRQSEETVSVVSYNIHECVGRDGRSDIDRIAAVLAGLGPDVAGLQEVHIPEGNGSVSQLGRIAAATGLRAISGPTLQRAGGDYGNALLARLAVTRIRRHDLSFRSREPRGALDVEMAEGERRLRVIATHLGLRPAERRFQVRELIRILGLSAVRPVVLLGDLNEWFAPGRPTRWLRQHFGPSPALRTFPSGLPLFPLDRIHVLPAAALVRIETVMTPASRLASDHLPLRAVVRLG